LTLRIYLQKTNKNSGRYVAKHNERNNGMSSQEALLYNENVGENSRQQIVWQQLKLLFRRLSSNLAHMRSTDTLRKMLIVSVANSRIAKERTQVTSQAA